MQAPGQTQQVPGAPGRGEAGRGAGGQAGGAARGGRGPAPKVPPEFDALPIWKMDPPKLVAMVKDPNSTLFQKAIACKKLAFTGGREAIQPMAALLSHPQLSCYARFGWSRTPTFGGRCLPRRTAETEGQTAGGRHKLHRCAQGPQGAGRPEQADERR